MNEKIYIGIDNGLTGGIAALSSDGRLLRKAVIPVESDGKKNRVVFIELRQEIWTWLNAESSNERLVKIVVERPGGSQNVQAAVSMADSFARIECALIGQGWPYEAITPQKWQNSKMFWTRPKMAKGQKFDTKAAALMAAKKLWPKEDWRRNERCRVAHDGMVDAALIAEYARRMNL